ncbi:hypothetical protein CC78DRAFT_536815 [Lojkania enalia]|uniref:Ubiquitin-like domain-containing protein n=1 Tax=Lojkania enalia TaxID=147567 RepID=A0A9P4K1Z1_9PLEO|nr:hypothetical protein CC78DRAFT_536815 [Didymosphaeria enalia]
MTDSNTGAPTAPPKKRSFFKKAAWQTAVKPEDSKDKDIFSHSNEYKDIVAEEARRKKERQARHEEQKRKEDEQRRHKRQRLSSEEPDIKSPASGLGRRTKTDIKTRSKSPPSLPGDLLADSLSARYDLLTKSLSSGSLPQKTHTIVDLGDDTESDEELYKSPQKPSNKPILVPEPAPVDDLEEIEDPRLATLAAKARERERAREAVQVSRSSHSGTPSTQDDPSKVAVVQLFITSDIANTKPLLIKIRINSPLEKPRMAWCGQQGFSKEMTENIFLTWKGNKLFDTTTVRRLGVDVDTYGNITVIGDSNLYTDEDLPKIHLQAWTEELFQQTKRQEAAEAEARKKALEVPSPTELEDPAALPETEIKKIRLILKAKGREDFKIQVKPDTTFSHLTAAYKERLKVPKNQPITLLFDGERLRPMDTIADSEIEDMDTIEVHFK